MEVEAHALFEMAKSEVLKQVGQEFDLSDRCCDEETQK